MCAETRARCLGALPFFVCTRQEISFSNGVKSRKKFHWKPLYWGELPLHSQGSRKPFRSWDGSPRRPAAQCPAPRSQRRTNVRGLEPLQNATERKHGVSPTAQDPNRGFIGTKLFESCWPRCARATGPAKESSEPGVFQGSRGTQGGTNRSVQTTAAKLSQEHTGKLAMQETEQIRTEYWKPEIL